MAKKMIFELSEEQTQRYLAWAGQTAGVDEPFSFVAIVFTLTNIGTEVVACRSFTIPESTSRLLLQELLDPQPDPVRFVDSPEE